MTRTLYHFKLIILAILVGIISGIVAIFFKELVNFFHNFFFYGEISLADTFFQHTFQSRWGIGIIFIPACAGIVVTFLIKHFAHEAKGHCVPEILYSIYYEQGRIRPIVSVTKALASSICIGSGGSAGPEGPIIQICATLGSNFGKWTRVKAQDLIILLASGASAGMAAFFNAPIGSILFVIEIMLVRYSAVAMIYIMLATIVATWISQAYYGSTPFFTTLALNNLSSSNLHMLVGAILLGVVVGLISALFIQSLYWSEPFFNRTFRNDYFRHMAGMLVVGINMFGMMYFFGHYYIQGFGHATISDVLNSSITNALFLFFLITQGILLYQS